MRSVTVAIRPDPSVVDPVEREIAADPSITREAIHAVERLTDDSFAYLVEFGGDLERARGMLADAPTVQDVAVTDEGAGFCYCHVDPSPFCRDLADLRESEEYVVRMPIEYAADGALRVTVVGREDDFTGSPFDLPAAYDVELVSAGSYGAESAGVFAALTDRQREVLETALTLGYYERPREATLEDVASEVDVEPGTVGKHLRAVESKVFSQYARAGAH